MDVVALLSFVTNYQLTNTKKQEVIQLTKNSFHNNYGLLVITSKTQKRRI